MQANAHAITPHQTVPRRSTIILAAWLAIGIALFVYGIQRHEAFVFAFIGTFVLLGWLGALLGIRETLALRSARRGSTRVVTVKQQWLGSTVSKYSQAGWSVEGQSTAKSFGSQARVTITFRKQG